MMWKMHLVHRTFNSNNILLNGIKVMGQGMGRRIFLLITITVHVVIFRIVSKSAILRFTCIIFDIPRFSQSCCVSMCIHDFLYRTLWNNFLYRMEKFQYLNLIYTCTVHNISRCTVILLFQYSKFIMLKCKEWHEPNTCTCITFLNFEYELHIYAEIIKFITYLMSFGEFIIFFSCLLYLAVLCSRKLFGKQSIPFIVQKHHFSLHTVVLLQF